MFVDNSYKWAGGGFISTSEDLVRFGSVLFQPGYLKAESLAMLFTPQKTKDGKETNYGMGWFIGKSKSGKRIFEHSGALSEGLPTLSSIPIRTWSLRLYATMTAKAGKARSASPCRSLRKIGETMPNGFQVSLER